VYAKLPNLGEFQIFLLSDSKLTPAQAAAQALDSLVLAQSPLLDLSRIAYVSSSTNELGLNPGGKIGDSIRSQLTGVGMAIPFVILADGARIGLGTFVSSISSSFYAGPNVTIENIQPDSLALMMTPTTVNPLKDSRVVKALSETGKLIP